MADIFLSYNYKSHYKNTCTVSEHIDYNNHPTHNWADIYLHLIEHIYLTSDPSIDHLGKSSVLNKPDKYLFRYRTKFQHHKFYHLLEHNSLNNHPNNNQEHIDKKYYLLQ